MKRIIFLLVFSLTSFLSFSQVAGRINAMNTPARNTPDPANLLYYRPDSLNAILPAIKDNLIWDQVQITGLPTDLSNRPTFTQADAAYKAIGYTPSYAEIVSALGMTPANESRTITINGVTHDLSANRSWAVGDISSGSTYANPSWITALAHSKVTYSGTSGQYVRGDGTFATFPSIPAAQVNSDWTSGSGPSQILNKPSLSPVATSGLYGDLTGTPTLATVATTGAYSDLTGKPSLISDYGPSGAISVTKRWVGSVTPSTGNGYSIDISSAGFSNIVSVSVVGVKNTNSTYLSPQVSVKSKSTSAIVVNITEANAATVSILGINVLSGAPLVFANVTGLTLDVIVYGN